MSQPLGKERFRVSCATVQAHPGYREDRISIRRAGEPDPIALIALPAGAATPWREALAAFGWSLAGDLEYVAGTNEERGQAELAQDAPGPVAEQLRESVRREIRARTLAGAAHPGAAHFQTVMANGDGSRDPIGWTFRLHHQGQDGLFAWVSAAGRLADGAGIGSRAEAARTVRHWHAAAAGAPAGPQPAYATFLELEGPELAGLLLSLRNGGPAVEEESAGSLAARSLASLKSRELAANRCVHHRCARDDSAGDPVAACAASTPGAVFGVLVDDDATSSFDCAVEAANEAARLNGKHDLPDDPFFTWALLCAKHEEQPEDGCERCATDGDGKEPAGKAEAMGESAGAPAPWFVDGDRMVCADGVTRTARGMAPVIPGEPVHVIVEGGAQWIAGNCLRANREDVRAAHERSRAAAARVHQDPDPGNPEWAAALDELGQALDFLKAADPRVRGALINELARQTAKRVHPDAHAFQPVMREDSDQAIAFTFRTGYGAEARYGVVNVHGEVSEVGLYEYPTTAERAFRQSLKDRADAVDYEQARPDGIPVR